jgi:hypothetical protein
MAAKKGEKNSMRLPRGIARVQFIANLEEIKRMLAEGHTLKNVYDTLCNSGKISMKYRSFYGLARPDKENRKKQ